MNERALATLENCRYCLMCRHVDPLGLITRRETLTPHGIALVAVSEQRGLIDWNEEMIGVLYSEVDAGVAQANCVTDQPFSEAVALVRAELVASRLAPAAVYELEERFRRHASPFGEAPVETAKGQAETALFVGDEAHHLWPASVGAACTLLGALGESPVPIGLGRSSGFLASSLGLIETARTQAKATLEELEATGAGRLVVLSPGDHFTLSQLYTERLGLDWPAGVEIVDLATLLTDALRAGRLAFTPASEGGAYAYVDPTHAARTPERFEAPRSLLRSLMPTEPVELFWHRQRAHPVGSTALQFTHPELADALTRARLEDARSRGAEVLFCEDPGSLAQLCHHAAAYNLAVRGLYETLATHLKP